MRSSDRLRRPTPGVFIVASGSLTVPAGTGTGSLSVTIKNAEVDPISAIAIVTSAVDTGVMVTYWAQNGAPGGQSSAGNNDRAVVFSGSLPPGQTANAIGSTTGALVGDTYSFDVYLTYQGSSEPQIVPISITAQP